METDNQADEGHLQDGAGAQLGAAGGHGPHVAVASSPVQED